MPLTWYDPHYSSCTKNIFISIFIPLNKMNTQIIKTLLPTIVTEYWMHYIFF